MIRQQRQLTAAFCLTVALAAACADTARCATDKWQKDIRQLITKVNPAVVAIHRGTKPESEKQPTADISLSTGVIVHTSGIAVTTLSAMREHGNLVVVLANGRRGGTVGRVPLAPPVRLTRDVGLKRSFVYKPVNGRTDSRTYPTTQKCFTRFRRRC